MHRKRSSHVLPRVCWSCPPRARSIRVPHNQRNDPTPLRVAFVREPRCAFAKFASSLHTMSYPLPSEVEGAPVSDVKQSQNSFKPCTLLPASASLLPTPPHTGWEKVEKIDVSPSVCKTPPERPTVSSSLLEASHSDQHTPRAQTSTSRSGG